MKTLALEQERSLRRVLRELTILLPKYLKKYMLISLLCLWRLCTVLVYTFFVPIKLYKLESVETLPEEVTLRDEYKKFVIPRGPFC